MTGNGLSRRVAVPRARHNRFKTPGGFRRMELVRRFIREEDGQDVVEYGLLIATIAIVVLVGISFFGHNIESWFQVLAGRITTTGIT